MKRNPEKTKLKVTFVIGVALILLVAIIMVAVTEYVVRSTEVIDKERLERSPFAWFLLFSLVSIVIGLGLVFILEKIILKPFKTLMDGMSKLANGEFETRLDAKNVMGIKTISDQFNTLASELQKIEILRSDFVNNFSHELKTPIASIKSLIGLLSSGEVPQEKKLAYMSIIREEIDRLSDMTTNILNLSKVENQGILTDKERINVSEQIRNCVLLLEKKWTSKNIELDFDFDEYYAFLSPDLIKQVWVNLLDNAIKFSDEGEKLKINLYKEEETLAVEIQNTGEEICESDYQKIFTKFYQCNSKSSRDGNGIGLSIVKHIVELHGGEILVKSENKVTTFTVRLPITSKKIYK